MPRERAVRDRFPIVVHVLLRRADTILLMRRCGTGYLDGYFAAPGGHVEAGEGVRAAAARECSEETTIDIDAADLTPAVVMPYRADGDAGVDFIFTTQRWNGEPAIGEPERCDRLIWCPVDALPDRCVPYLAPTLDMLRRGEWFKELES